MEVQVIIVDIPETDIAHQLVCSDFERPLQNQINPPAYSIKKRFQS